MLYLADFVSINGRKHAHLIYVQPPAQGASEQVDPATGQPVPLPPSLIVTENGRRPHSHVANLSGGQIYVEENDGHTHPVIPIDQSEPSPVSSANDDEQAGEEPENDLILRKLTQFQEAWDYWRDSIEKGKESVEFREGEQWDDDTRSKLNEANRACLTINHVASMIESLSGIYRQNRTDLRVYPVTGGDEYVSDALTYAIKQVFSSNNFNQEEALAFEDLLVPGYGCVEDFVDYDTDLQGFIRLRHVPWDMVLWGPHLRYDQSDCDYVFRWRWISQAVLRAMYPEKKDQIASMFQRFYEFDAEHEDMSDLDSIVNAPLFRNSLTKEIRLMECEEKEYRNVRVFVDSNTGFSVSEEQVPPKVRSSLDQLPLNIVQRRVWRIRKTIIAGSAVLDDLYPDFPQPPNSPGPAFSIQAAYAYKRGSHFEGKVERAKDAQREINKRRSQVVDILNTCINNGWIIEDMTFKGRRQEEQFRKDVSSAGFVAKVSDISRPPVKVESGQVQPGVVQLELASLQSFRDITNVNPQLLGIQESANESGVAIQMRQRQALVGNESLFDNMSKMKIDLGRKVILHISSLYSPERIARLVWSQAQVESVFLGGQPLDPQSQQAFDTLVARIKDADLTLYDVELGETGQSPSAQMSNFSMLMEMARAGLAIPPEALIQASPLPNKEQLLQQLQAQQQQQQANEERKYQTELQKVALSKGLTPTQGSGQQGSEPI